MPFLRSSCTVLALLALACASPAVADRGSFVGAREWFGPLGTGHLDLREDSSFRLTLLLALPDDSGLRQELAGSWEPRGPHAITLHVRESHALVSNAGDVASPMSPGTSIDARLDRDSATYLGVDGVVDLNWGY